MRKVFRGALVIAISGAMLGGFSACKDTQDDYRYEVEQEFTDALNVLRDKDSSLEAVINAQKDALEAADAELQRQINAIKQCDCDNEALKNSILAELEAAKSELESKINALDQRIAALESAVYVTPQELADAIADVNTTITNLQTSIANTYATKDELQTVSNNLQALSDELENVKAGLSQQIKDAITEALKNYATLNDLADSTSAVRQEAADNLAEAKRILSEETQKVASDLADLESSVDVRLGDLETAYKDADAKLQAQIDDLKERVAANEKAIEALQKQLAKLVTSVIIQGTYNPMVGSLSLPANIQSNILCAYYGVAENNIDFPSVKTSNLVDPSRGISQAELKLLKDTGLSQILSVENGEYLIGDEGNAGKLYLTVNPTAVDFEGLNFSLVNSLDENSGVTLSSITPSKDKLTFGYTRGEAANGFYEAKATIKKENLATAQLNIDKSALKSAVKDLYKNRTSANFTTIVGTLYSTLNDVMDRNAVKASWSVDGQDNSVYSQYGIAAFAYNPLSYAFCSDAEYHLSLPTFDYNVPNLDDINLDLNIGSLDLGLNLDFDFNLEIKEFQLGEVDLTNSTVNVTFTYDTPEYTYDERGNKIVVTAYTEEGELIIVMKEKTETISVSLADFAGDLTTQLNDKINEAMKDILGDLSAQIKSQIKDQIVDQLNNQIAEQLNDSINDLLADLSSQIKDQVVSYTSKYQNYLDKLQTLINRVNNVINKVNGVNIAGVVNRFLQPTLVYQAGSGKFGLLSSSKNNPTLVKVAGGNALTLHPTSLSGEYIAPAFKKFVGVVNVYSNDNSSVSAQNGDAKCLAAAKKVNSLDYVDEVIDGARYGVPFVGEAGYTYEIVYAALDYQGKVALNRYYVKVI